MNEFIRQIFGIDTGFQGTVLSSFAKMNLESVTEEVNDKVLVLSAAPDTPSIFNRGPMPARKDQSRIHHLHPTLIKSFSRIML